MGGHFFWNMLIFDVRKIFKSGGQMPGVPGYPWPGADRSAEVHQPCLQCCSAADSGWCAGRWCSQPPDTASLSFISLMQTPTPGGTLSWNWGEWVGWLGNPSLSGFYYSSRPLNNKGLNITAWFITSYQENRRFWFVILSTNIFI